MMRPTFQTKQTFTHGGMLYRLGVTYTESEELAANEYYQTLVKYGFIMYTHKQAQDKPAVVKKAGKK